ncbi:unnamed protein product [Rotaria sordida]|uniref:DUF4291 domain-containing protein n=1 Tax=Rotaria sordida TaxID=392033 RepID=A0A813WGG0_9BILA|nr:unnamed protein product [Rotaria sordida]CAF0741633.1 unnamed protein product [Rotaria sordida]CAF0760202.1 unnamed protein product [Rotaria sordida]CAF0843610.1 unnamed protein product [Rotaria sordida]CAF0853140.1 unnamed protein product [Rotaria sordida]
MDWLSKYENATELYNDAERRWPTNKENPPPGKWILASFDDESIIVYQAYNSEIAKFACENNRFTGCPGYNQQRMTWIKTNFLWMMYRSQWATSSNQQHILAIWLRRSAFDSYLAQALHSSHKGLPQDDEQDSKNKIHQGLIRLQWDPDHHPHGQPIHGRRAIQLGLKKIESFLDGRDIIRIVDITSFVQTQYNNAVLPKDQLDQLRVPIERIYVPSDEQICRHIRLDTWTEQEE